MITTVHAVMLTKREGGTLSETHSSKPRDLWGVLTFFERILTSPSAEKSNTKRRKLFCIIFITHKMKTLKWRAGKLLGHPGKIFDVCRANFS